MLNIFILLWNTYFYWRLESSRLRKPREREGSTKIMLQWMKQKNVGRFWFHHEYHITSTQLEVESVSGHFNFLCNARTGNKEEPWAAWWIWFSLLRAKIITLSKRRQKGLLVGPYKPLRYFLTVSYLVVKVTGGL